MTTKRYTIIFITLIIFMLVLLIAPPLWAQDCGEFGYRCDDNSVVANPTLNNTVGGSNLSAGGNDSLALGFGGVRFGAAIGDCMGTQARTFLFGLYGQQTLTESYWCESFNLFQAGHSKAAIWILCNRTILKEMEDCEKSFVVDESGSVVDDEVHVDHIQVSQQQFQMADTRMSEMVAWREEVDRGRQAAARRAAEDRAFNQETLDKLRALQ